LDWGVLVVVDLGSLDLDQFVADIGHNMKHDLVLDHVLDHVIIVGFQKLQTVLSVDVEERIVGNGNLELGVLGVLCNEPGVVDEVSSLLKLWIHDN
jgi:hypothetical protein